MEHKKYDRELAVEKDNSIYAGKWAVEQMAEKPYSIGFVDDPFEGIRKLEIPHLTRHIAFVSQTGYGYSSAFQNLALQVHREGSFIYVHPNRDTQIEECIPKDELLTVSVKDNQSDFTLDLFGSNNDSETSQFVAELLIDLLSTDTLVTPFQVNVIEKGVEIALQTPAVSTVQDFSNLLFNREKLESVATTESVTQLEEELRNINNEKLEALQMRINRLATNEYLNTFIDASEDSYTVEEFGELVESPEFSIMYTGYSNEASVRFFPQLVHNILSFMDTPKTEKALFLDGLESLDKSEKWLPDILSTSRAYNLGIVTKTKELTALPDEASTALLYNCGTVILGNAAHTQEANKWSSIFEEYDRNHFLNQTRRFGFTANVTNKYSESITLTGGLFTLVHKNDAKQITGK